MSEPQAFEDLLLAIVAPILDALKVFERSSRYLGPSTMETVRNQLLDTRRGLRDASANLDESIWPPAAVPIRDAVSAAYGHALRSLERLAEADGSANDLMPLYRALGARAPMCEAIYPLAQHFSLVHRFFLDHEKQEVPRLSQASTAEPVGFSGVHHIANDRKQRGGYSIYVPESFDPARRYPVVFALHGGSGHGSSFLWSWIRTCRTEELVLVSPTSVGGTWAIMGEDLDTPNLLQMLESMTRLVQIDETKLLLTGMSDGGTFTYVSGCTASSPFTHLAPCSASFHPMLIEMMAKDRLRDLPICITHGALDWMFTVDIAQTAEYSFNAAGANVFYREIADLAHTYPEDANPELVKWFLNTNASG